jgi:hypothetical protein
MFAPCLLGRPGTGRQKAVLMSLPLAGLRYSSACHSIPVTQVFKKVPLSNGLLIRRFGFKSLAAARLGPADLAAVDMLITAGIAGRSRRLGPDPHPRTAGLREAQ